MVAADLSYARRSPPSGSETAAATPLTGMKLPWPVMIYLFAIMMPIGFWLGPLYMTPIRLISFVVTVPLSIMLLSGRFGRVYMIDILFYLHVLWMGVSLFVNNPDRAIENLGATSVEFLGGYLIARAFIRTRAQFITLCKWIGLMVVVTLPLAIYETRTGNPIVVSTIRSLPGLTSEVIMTMPVRMGLERVQALFAHPIHYGLFCSLAFSFTFLALKDVYSTKRRYLVCGLIGACTFLALSSGAILAVLLQIALMSWYWIFRKYNARWWLLAGLFALAYVFVDIMSTRSPVRVFMTYASFNAQTAFFRGAINEWGMMNVLGDAANGVPGNPIFGLGLRDWIRPWWMHLGSVDNFWLLMMMRHGIPGLLLLLAGYVWALWRIGRRDFRGDSRMELIRRAWMFTFLGMTFTLTTVHVWTTLYSYVFFLLGAGLWMISTPTRPDETTENTVSDEVGSTAPASPYTRFPSGVDAQGNRRNTAPEPARARDTVSHSRAGPEAAQPSHPTVSTAPPSRRPTAATGVVHGGRGRPERGHIPGKTKPS